MAKTKKRNRREIKPKTGTGVMPSLTYKQQDLFFLAIITILLLILLKPLAIDGLSPQGVDAVGTLGQTHQILEYTKDTGEAALWNPYIFCGMPQYHLQ